MRASCWLVCAEVLLVAGLVAVSIVQEHHAASGVLSERTSNLANGTTIAKATSGPDGGLTVDMCRSAYRLSGVLGVGWERQAGTFRSKTLPDLEIGQVLIGGDLPAMIGLSTWTDLGRQEQAVLGELVSVQLGLQARDLLSPTAGTRDPTIVSTVVTGPRSEGFAFSLLLADGGAPGRVSSCWVDFGRNVRPADRDLLRTVLGGDTVNISELSPASTTLEDAYETRISRYGWMASVLLALGLYWVIDWSRRAETVLYRALGVGRVALLVVRAVERSCVIVAATSLGFSVSFLLTGSEWDAALRRLRISEALAIAGVLLAISIATTRTFSSRRLVAILKDR